MSAGTHTTPARRTVLLAAAAAVTAAGASACGLDLGAVRRDDGAPGPPGPPGADERARRRAVADAGALLRAASAAAGDGAGDGAADGGGGAVGAAPRGAPGAEVAGVLAETVTICREHLTALRPVPTGDAAGPGADPVVEATGETTGDASGDATGDASGDATGDATGDASRRAVTAPADVVARLRASAARALTDAAVTGGPTARLLVSVGAARAVLAARLAAAAGLPAPVPAFGDPFGDDGAGRVPADPADGADPAPEPAPPAGVAAAASAAVTGERAAAYGYGVMAVRLGGPARERAETALTEHALTADRLAAVAAGAGVTLTSAWSPPAWRVPEPVTGARAAVTLATAVEGRTAALHADLVAAATGALRAAATDALLRAALRRAAWAGAAQALPGLPAAEPGTAPTP